MKKKFMITILAVTAFAVAGCGSGKNDREKDRASLKDKRNEQTVKEDEPENRETKEEKKSTKEKNASPISSTRVGSRRCMKGCF